MEGCKRIVTLAQFTLAAGLFAATLLQFVGALYVREYARGIWIEEMREEEARSMELDPEITGTEAVLVDVEKR